MSDLSAPVILHNLLYCMAGVTVCRAVLVAGCGGSVERHPHQ